MTNEKLKVFCTEISMQVSISQGAQIFMEEVIRDAEMLYSYIRLSQMPKQIGEEKDNPIKQ